MKSTLYLHVGHSKTGTSWVQAALRENADALAEAGLAYPILEGVGNEQGAEIGQGNGLWLATGPAGELELRLRMIARAAGPAGAVLSTEEFFPRLARHGDPAVLPRAARAAGFGGIEILLFIRNPVGHAASMWQQYLKTAGGTAPIDAFFEKYSVPELVAHFLDRFLPIDGVGLTCLSYDRHRHDLLAPLRAWLGLPAATLAPPCAPTINRGMTRGGAGLAGGAEPADRPGRPDPRARYALHRSARAAAGPDLPRPGVPARHVRATGSDAGARERAPVRGGALPARRRPRARRRR